MMNGCSLFLALSLLCAGSSARAQGAADDLVLIVNAQSPLEAKVAPEKVRDAYLGRSVGGARIKTVNRTDQTLTAAFIEKFTGMTLGSYKSFWVKKLMSEGGTGPKTLDTPAEILRFVSEEKAALAYLEKKELPAKTPGVRVLGVLSDKEPVKK